MGLSILRQCILTLPQVLYSRTRMSIRLRVSYLRYILPLFPTLATVNCRPSLPAELPSGVIVDFTSSISRCARRFMLFSFRNPSMSCFFFHTSTARLPAVFDRWPVSIPCFDIAGFSRPVAFACSPLPNGRRGDMRSRCRWRRDSGVWALLDRCEATKATSASSIVLPPLDSSHSCATRTANNVFGFQFFDALEG